MRLVWSHGVHDSQDVRIDRVASFSHRAAPLAAKSRGLFEERQAGERADTAIPLLGGGGALKALVRSADVVASRPVEVGEEIPAGRRHDAGRVAGGRGVPA